jgi:hypothetical protein
MFTVTFNPQTPEQLQVVAVAMASYLSLAAVEVETVVETPKAKRARKPEEPSIEAPPEATFPAATFQLQANPVVVTLVEVRAKLADLSQKGHGNAVRELLAKFGVKKLTDVLVEDFASLLAEAEAI